MSRRTEPFGRLLHLIFLLLIGFSLLLLAAFAVRTLASAWPGDLRQLNDGTVCEILHYTRDGAWTRLEGRCGAWFLPIDALQSSHPLPPAATVLDRDGRWFHLPGPLQLTVDGRDSVLSFSQLQRWRHAMAADLAGLRDGSRNGRSALAPEYRQLLAHQNLLTLRTPAGPLPLTRIAVIRTPVTGPLTALQVAGANLSSSATGIGAALAGTALTTLFAALFASPLGLAAAIWLSEFARPNLLTRLFRSSVQLLSGIPPIVFGVFGLVFLIRGIGHIPGGGFAAPSLLWASLTLGLLALPTVTHEANLALQRFPATWREASLTCGASRLQTFLRTVLPQSRRPLLAAVLMGSVRALAETSPLLLTGAVELSTRPLFSPTPPFAHPLNGFEHLGTFIYHGIEQGVPGTSGTDLEALACLILSLSAIGLRALAARLRHPRSLP